jgi:hypothetical protein
MTISPGFVGFMTGHEAESREDRCPQNEEMNERFAEKLHKNLQNYFAGVYQIGEV